MSLLFKEYEDIGIINFKNFWICCIKRLLLVVFVLIVVVGIVILLLYFEYIVRVKYDMIVVIFYVFNWWYIVKDVNYFE